MKKTMRFVRAINAVNDWVGRIISFSIFPIIGIVVFEVVMRYFLRKSQLWVPETSVFFFGALFVLGGGYALLKDSHVKLDIIYNKFSPRNRAIIDIATCVFFFAFCGVLVWRGGLTAWESLTTMEQSPSAFAPLLFPARFLIPIGSTLLILQGISKLVCDVATIFGGNRN